jgi:hypothetical protein
MISFSGQDVEEALEEIDRQGIPRKRRSTGYCLVARDGHHYPPKHVLRTVLIAKTGEKPMGLFGGKRTNMFLQAQGYLIERCDCRNANRKIVD